MSDELIDWIVNVLNYPIDFSTDPPIPEKYREAVIDAWIKRDHIDVTDEEDLASYRAFVPEEGGW